MFVNIVSRTILVVFSLALVPSQVYTQKRNVHQFSNDKHSKLDKATTTTTVSYFMDSPSSGDENVDKLEENSTDIKRNDFYKVTTTTTLSYFVDSQSSSPESVDDQAKMQEKNVTRKNHNDETTLTTASYFVDSQSSSRENVDTLEDNSTDNKHYNFYKVTTTTTVSYFEDSQSSTEEIVDDNVRLQNSTENKHAFGNVTSVAFVPTVTIVAEAENIANDNKTNITMKDTWIKRRGLFILIPAVLVVTAGMIALLILRRVNIVTCFNKKGSYDVQGHFLRLNTKFHYDSFEDIQFIPH
ncbi:uncharacterized protein LOC118266833 [Spodoptera frugiperda]|uniref:Uncharacterized protein LOC118266833 n=1 Tax=Spodoptera frugiperda TaxID=7108 RepID=A0A9R0EIK4_SPOFR|nr:uncharacterized protein LOC118266833 [Spodoptera frugiperda]